MNRTPCARRVRLHCERVCDFAQIYRQPFQGMKFPGLPFVLRASWVPRMPYQ